jgi:hypothetical protein
VAGGSNKKNTQARLGVFFLFELFIGDPERISFTDPQKLRFENQQKKHQQHPK